MSDLSALIEFVDPKQLKAHPLSIEIYGDGAHQDLVESIKELGILQALHVTNNNIILSGNRRWRAAMAAGCTIVPIIRTNYANELDERQAIIEHNRYRIKNGQQLYNEGKELERIEAERARQRQGTSGPGVYGGKPLVENFPQAVQGKTRDIVASTIGLGSGRQWDKLEYVAEHKPSILQEIRHDGISLSKAYTEARKAINQATTGPAPELPEGIFQVLYMDPPWKYDNSGLGGSAEYHYRTRTVDEILTELQELDFASHVAPDSALFLWATNPLLPDALRLIDGLGFTYKTNLVWVKDKPTYGKLGFYVYGQHELLLVATKGSMLPGGDKPPSVIYADVKAHSRKPQEACRIIGQMYPGTRKCELFARERREGWEAWGDQLSGAIS